VKDELGNTYSLDRLRCSDSRGAHMIQEIIDILDNNGGIKITNKRTHENAVAEENGQKNLKKLKG
jgi:hypothetical protein